MERTVSDEFRHPELFAALEQSLKYTLNPVQPNPDFVQHLEHRLVTKPTIVLEPRSGELAFVAIALGLFSGALIIWIIHLLTGRSKIK
jgi:hypothetical protein